jgi:hypothetical protein
MISFFRKIRQKLLQKNQVTRYLAYAVGEILLVVIGILIALQINTWNENQKNKSKEKLIIKNLHLEFQKNKEKLQASIEHHQAILGSTQMIMDLIAEQDANLNKYNLDSLLEKSLDYLDYSPSQSVLSDLISSGNLNLITSEELRTLIFDWGTVVDEKKEAFDTLDEINQTLVLSYLVKNVSMKNIDSYGILNSNKKSKFKPDMKKLLQDMEFENTMDNQVWGITNYLLKLESLELVVNEIISQTNPNTLLEQ